MATDRIYGPGLISVCVDNIASMYGLDDKIILDGYRVCNPGLEGYGARICIDGLLRKGSKSANLEIFKDIECSPAGEGREARILATKDAMARQISSLKANGVSVIDCMWDDKYRRTPAPTPESAGSL